MNIETLLTLICIGIPTVLLGAVLSQAHIYPKTSQQKRAFYTLFYPLVLVAGVFVIAFTLDIQIAAIVLMFGLALMGLFWVATAESLAELYSYMHLHKGGVWNFFARYSYSPQTFRLYGVILIAIGLVAGIWFLTKI